MALVKQNLNVPFAYGVDQKTDPKQVEPGKFLRLVNSRFDKQGLLQKRFGFGFLPGLPVITTTTLTTFNGNLTAIGNSLYALSSSNNEWLNTGNLQPARVSVLPMVRSSTSQTTSDVAISDLGLACTTWLDSDGVSKYQVVDAATGQIFVSQVSLPATATMSRVFVLGSYFVITFLATVAAAPHIQYIAIPINNPSSPSAATDISTQISSISAGYDAVIANQTMYVAWNGNDGGGAIRVKTMDRNLNQSLEVHIDGHSATLMSVTADNTTSTPQIWITYYDSGTKNAFTVILDQALNVLTSQFQTINNVTINNLTSSAQNSVGTIYYQVDNNYSFAPNNPTDFTSKVVYNAAGTLVSGPMVILRSVGLASKSFIFNNNQYVFVVYQGIYQPTYFLIDSSGHAISKFAYENGGGYMVNQILSNVTILGNTCSMSYRFKDLLAPVNKSIGANQVAGIYSQTGINLMNVDLSNSPIVPCEIGQALNLTGGFLWMYDGVKPVEQNFHIFPEDDAVANLNFGGSLAVQTYYYAVTYEWTDAQGNLHRSAQAVPISVIVATLSNTVISSVSTGSDTLTVTAHGLSTGFQVRFTTTGGLPAPLAILTDYYVIVVDANTIKVATTYNNAIAGTAIDITTAGSGTNTMVPANAHAVQINIPTARITYKVAPNPIRIVIYRWSTANQVFYQITSITSPILNDPTIDSILYTDTVADASIIGNLILYTTGGVLENTGGPASNIMTLFKSRLFLVKAENDDTLSYSKQVIQNTPVEMSDQLTIFAAPTISSTGSTLGISAAAPMDDKLILFKRNKAIYYITGDGPDNTGAQNNFSEPIFITSTATCSNMQSLALMPQGLMFESDENGIWILKRDLSTDFIGKEVEDYTRAATVVSSIVVPEENQVRFSLSSGIMLVYDYYYGQWGTFENIPSISSTNYQSQHTFLNVRGEVYQETPGLFLDGANPVLMSFTSSWFKLTGLQGYGRAYFFYLLGDFYTPHKLHLQIAYDYDPTIIQSTIISPDNFSPTYGGLPFWGSDSPWGGPSQIEQWRIFLERQRCQAFQIIFDEIYDATLGIPAGAGLTMSGINLVVGAKRQYPTLRAAKETS